MANQRYLHLDGIRGIAVMGILLMNIVAFAMPKMAYINPATYGGTTTPDVITWATMFILVDSKMRGIFSLLFGASMLLVYERAEATDANGAKVHLRRMMWLLGFGIVHYYLIWFGDILILYALCGMVGMALLNQNERQLRTIAIWLFILNFLLMAIIMLGLLALQYAAAQQGADAELVKAFGKIMIEFGQGDQAIIAKDISLYQSGYLPIVIDKFTNGLYDPFATFFTSGLETVGLMALGMMMFRNGFLTGGWDNRRYIKTMLISYLIGLPPLFYLAYAGWNSGFDAMVVVGNMLAWSMPFRIAVMIGHAALFMLLIKHFAQSTITARIVATGQAAFSNYLGTSILMTLLFYGYGLGWYGILSRTQTYLIVPCVWVLMLLWSKPWLDRFHYGPLEWLWRSLARGERQKMRR